LANRTAAQLVQLRGAITRGSLRRGKLRYTTLQSTDLPEPALARAFFNAAG
jgi:hypothetical protein